MQHMNRVDLERMDAVLREAAQQCLPDAPPVTMACGYYAEDLMYVGRVQPRPDGSSDVTVWQMTGPDAIQFSAMLIMNAYHLLVKRGWDMDQSWQDVVEQHKQAIEQVLAIYKGAD